MCTFEPVRILVIGDLIKDVDIHGTCNRLAAESPCCPVFAETRREERPGGAGAVAVMCLGLDAAVHSITGPKVSVKTRFFVEGQQMWRQDSDALPLTAPEVAALADEVHAQFEQFWNIVLIADYGKGVCTYPVVREAIDRAARAGIPCLVDPAHGVDWRTYRKATCIKCNHFEYSKGSTNWSKHVEHCVVTHGDHGLYHFGNDYPDAHYPSRHSNMVDVTGAGDMVLASLGVCLARGLGWPLACRFAAIAAGLKVERRGAVAVPLQEVLSELFASGAGGNQTSSSFNTEHFAGDSLSPPSVPIGCAVG